MRPPIRPLTDSRSERVLVAAGSMAYSAVTQPRPEPLRQRGTPSEADAAQSTFGAAELDQHRAGRVVEPVAGDGDLAELVVGAAVGAGSRSHGDDPRRGVGRTGKCGEPGPVTPVSYRTRLEGPYPSGTKVRGPTPRSSLHAVVPQGSPYQRASRIGPTALSRATKVGVSLARLTAVETRPTASETQPALRWVDHAWRDALCVVFSAVVWTGVADIEWREHRTLFVVEVVLGVAAFVLVHFRRRAPVLIALVIAAMSAMSGIAAGPATLAAVSVATRRDLRHVLLVGLGQLRRRADLDHDRALRRQRRGGHDRGEPRRQRRDDGLGPLHRLAARAAVDPADPCRTGRDRAGPAAGAGPLDRAGPDRPGDARRAGPPDHAGVDAGGCARVPRRPRQPAAARGTRPDPGPGQRRPPRAARRPRRAARGRPGTGHRPTAADVRRHPGAGRRGPGPRPRRRLDRPRRRHDAGAAGDRSHGLPDRAGGDHQRAQARARLGGRDQLHRRPALGDHRDPGQPPGRPVADGGTGAPGAGLGLVGLRERTELRGGRLDQRTEGATFVLEAWLPWTA